MIDRQQLDYFEISETKLGCSFPFAQFHIWDYGLRNRRDRDKSGGGLTEFVNKEIITERLKDLETNLSETIYTELTISKKMWFCICTDHHLPNIDTFFAELTIVNNSSSKAVNTFDISLLWVT